MDTVRRLKPYYLCALGHTKTNWKNDALNNKGARAILALPAPAGSMRPAALLFLPSGVFQSAYRFVCACQYVRRQITGRLSAKLFPLRMGQLRFQSAALFA
jgi:hypothetical protein